MAEFFVVWGVENMQTVGVVDNHQTALVQSLVKLKKNWKDAVEDCSDYLGMDVVDLID